MSSILDDVKFQFRTGNKLFQLIFINCAFFLLAMLIKLLAMPVVGAEQINVWYFTTIYDYLALPLNPAEIIYKPWTLITSMFFHRDVSHILWNMLILYWFGQLFQEYLQARRVFPVFIMGGLVGYVFAITGSYFTFGGVISDGNITGASAGLMAIIFAISTLIPDYEIRLLFIGFVRLKYLTAFYVILDLINITYVSNIGGHWAHLGGALLGFIFTKRLQAGSDWSLWLNKIGNKLKLKKGNTLSYSTGGNFSRAGKQELSNAERQKRVDEILDKISRSGYESLSKEEKEELFKMSGRS